MAGLKNIAKGCLLSAGYCAAFLLAWRCSVDQWYLPAGLRLAALLFLPYRLWPYLLAGDAAALLMIRVPMVDRGASLLWAYMSPFLLMPAVALLVLTARRHIPHLRTREHWILPLALAVALWSTLCNIAINTALRGYTSLTPLEALLRYWLGDYLGMLMFALPALLWWRRKDSGEVPSRLLRDGALSVAAVVALSSVVHVVSDPLLRQILMLLLVAPAIALTFLHGWRGAALGVVLANVAIGISLPETMTLAVHHAEAFQVQLLLAAVATGLFAFGSRLSTAFERACRIARAREQALQFAQASYLQAERALRKRVVDYTDIQIHVNKMRKDIVTYLRARGQHAAAMETLRLGMIQARLLDDYVTALYPLDIETHGLYATLRSTIFASLCNTEFRLRLRGDPKRLSLSLQLVAYRCVLNAVETLPPAHRHVIKARVWQANGMQGVVVHIIADASVLDVKHVHNDADQELAIRLQAHGGTCRRRHAYSLSFLVSERIAERISSPQ